MTQVDVNNTLDAWTETVEKLLNAISEKNFKNFRRAFSEGCRHFRTVSRFISENDIADDLKKRILMVSDRWVKATGPLSEWKDEVGTELKVVKQGNKVRGKISRAYFFKPSQTGKNLRRKAR